MGYYTRYSLRQIGNPIAPESLAELIIGDQIASYALMPDGDTRDWEKWYEHEAILCAWSRRYPKTLFCLHAEGEDPTGIWDKYFLADRIVHAETFEGLPSIDPNLIVP